jgi:hypothetical protein
MKKKVRQKIASRLTDAINETRIKVWKQQGPDFVWQTAKIDADGTYVGTLGNCKEGMALSYKNIWGYHALLVSSAITQEPLFFLNRSGNRHRTKEWYRFTTRRSRCAEKPVSRTSCCEATRTFRSPPSLTGGPTVRSNAPPPEIFL